MSNIIDKNGLLENIDSSQEIMIELGCGSRKKNSAAIGIDILDYPDVDIVGDIFEVLKKFPDACIEHVSSHHFIEHVDDIELLMSELARIMKYEGVIDFVAPHFSNPYYYSDPTHRSFFGLYTFCYMSYGTLFSRKVPTYQSETFFNLESVDLVFKSAKPFYGRYLFKSLLGKIFNSCTYMKEWYEENLCYLFPCYEVRYLLIRRAKPNS